MDNQHRKIKGYRELTQAEVDLMNRIKAKGAELLELQAELERQLRRSKQLKHREAFGGVYVPVDLPLDQESYTEQHEEYVRFVEAEPFRWASIGKTDIQTGVMALVRAVAQPEGV